MAFIFHLKYIFANLEGLDKQEYKHEFNRIQQVCSTFFKASLFIKYYSCINKNRNVICKILLYLTTRLILHVTFTWEIMRATSEQCVLKYKWTIWQVILWLMKISRPNENDVSNNKINIPFVNRDEVKSIKTWYSFSYTTFKYVMSWQLMSSHIVYCFTLAHCCLHVNKTEEHIIQVWTA